MSKSTFEGFTPKDPKDTLFVKIVAHVKTSQSGKN